ncbi:hypothetical protein QZJ86_12245 [Methylomonas montana]|uniref:hypothetical protein n=1 Tax=Methylomonas montana TaxID=3058963 RepID=UPI0026587E2E|nr:hypothetical protein [Methylomonas montana]WKJ88793.1 hypothetical protein QZJ86_12245 [Methylomonas montana]
MATKPATTDLFEAFSNKCPICKMGYPELIDDTDNPNRALVSMEPIAAYQCDTCGWKTAGHVVRGDYIQTLEKRWSTVSKIQIASARYDLGISNIANRLSAWEFYFCYQMVE